MTRVGLGCVALLAAGCVASLDQPKARDERRVLPSSFPSPAPLQDVQLVAQKRYDTFFPDTHLRTLIGQGLQNNQEFNIRVQEIILARNEVFARRGEIFPKVDLGTGVGLERVGTETSQGVADEAHGVPADLPDFHYGLNASWEIDLWGKLRKATQAADHRYLATVEAKNFLVTEIVGEIASGYFELIALDGQIDVLTQNVKILDEALAVVKLQKAAGRATELPVRRFEAEILRVQGKRYALLQQRVATENHLNMVVGRYPQHVERAAAFPEGPARLTLNTGLPAALLSNRPDVREAELGLKAAKLDVEVARARFYPSLTIDASLGLRAFNPLHLISLDALGYGLAGSVMLPLLNRAGITADYRAANARQIQAVFVFEQTLLRAFTEVATQISRVDNVTLQYQQVSKQAQTLEDAVTISNLLYQSARADYMEVLMTRRDFLEAQLECTETRQKKMQALVALYQALGGGWQGRDAAADIPR